MKKTIIRNFVLVLILISTLLLICTFSYSYISNQIINDNINNNLKKIVGTTTTSIEQQFQIDHNRLKTKIDTYTKDENTSDNLTRVKNKIAIVESHKDELLYGSSSGIGGYVEDSVKGDYFLINGKKYQDQNSADHNQEKEYDVIIADLGKDFKVETGQTNDFTGADSIYIVYQLGDIIVYFKASDTFNAIFVDEKIIDDYYLINLDGGIRYTTSKKGKLLFYDLLIDEGNSKETKDILIYEPIENISKDNPYAIVNNIKYNNKTSWMLASSLTTDEISNNLYLVLIIDNESAVSSLRTVFAPLLATFFLVLIIVAIALVISYYIIGKKHNDLTNITNRKYGKPVYEIKLRTDGTIINFDANFKELLKDIKEYQKFSDFEFVEDYDDISSALFKQLPFTIKLAKEKNNKDKDLIFRCSILKEFNHYIAICLDSTSIEEKNDKYRTIATINPTTGDPNMEVFKEDIVKSIYNIKTEKTIFKTSLLYVHLINYQNLGLFYGKKIGEQIQRLINQRLKEICEGLETKLYTLAPDSTGIILSNLDTYEEANDLAKKIEKDIKKPIEFGENRIILEASIAIYNLDPDVYTLNDAGVIVDGLERLSGRMNQNATKKIDIFTPSVEKYISNEEAFEEDLKTAVLNNEFVMYLQPQYNIFEHRIQSFELLIRWNNPKYIRESPQHFIEVAEKNGLIIQIGRFVNEESLRIAKELEKYDLEFSLNVSPAQFIQTGFVSELIDLVNKYEVDPNKISLEVTETFLMENLTVMSEKLKELKRYGFKIHLDDFGVGHSSLLYLKELPVDALKIDKEFTRFISSDKFSRNTIRFITNLARNLELGIICEGVEDEKQLNFLARNECSLIQGYILSPPVPIDEAIELIDEYNIKKTKIINDDKKEKRR